MGGDNYLIKYLFIILSSAHQKRKLHDRLDKRQAFKMILWLVTYYEFFAKKVASQIYYRTTIDFTIIISGCVIIYFVQKSSQALGLVVDQQLKHYIKDDSVI